MARIDHVGIAVRSLAQRLRFWTEGLGLPMGGTEDVEGEGVRVAFLAAGEARVELLEALGDDSPVARFVEKRGEGIHHLTLEVEDLAGTLERLRGLGVKVLGEGIRSGAGGRGVAFLHPASCGGVLVELAEAAARPDRLEPGKPVVVYLRDPSEKLWGVLRRLDPSGIVVEAIDLSSFDEWVRQVEHDATDAVGPSVLFYPMLRVERLLLDRPSGSLPSLADRFLARTGRSVESVMRGEP